MTEPAISDAEHLRAPRKSRSSTQAPRLIAVIDCGSSAIRASIAEVHPDGRRQVLNEVGLPINLFQVFTVNGFNRADMDGVVHALVGS